MGIHSKKLRKTVFLPAILPAVIVMWDWERSKQQKQRHCRPLSSHPARTSGPQLEEQTVSSSLSTWGRADGRRGGTQKRTWTHLAVGWCSSSTKDEMQICTHNLTAYTPHIGEYCGYSLESIQFNIYLRSTYYVPRTVHVGDRYIVKGYTGNCRPQ